MNQLKQFGFFKEFDESLIGTFVVGLILLILAKHLSK